MAGTSAKLTGFLKRHERRLSIVAFLTGFIWDNLTLTRIDLLYDNLVLAAYLTVAGTLVIVLRRIETRGERERPKLHAVLVLSLQFAFGGLFSGLLVFYSRSGALMESWPFLALLGGLLIGNEFLRKRYLRHAFRVGIFYFVLLSYLILILPVALGQMGVYVFLASGIASLFIVRVFLKIAWHFSGKSTRSSRLVGVAIVTIFSVVNWLYFTDRIPPIPLSMKSIGVYHGVERVGDVYHVLDEVRPWHQELPFVTRTFHRSPGDAVYAYSAVFAPTKLSTSIAHLWRYQDPRTGEWTTVSTIPFTIRGGRDGGYRGYTMKEQVADGVWRVDVVADDGKVIGRIDFEVVSVTAPVSTTVEVY